MEGAFDAVDAVDAADVGEDGFELALIGDFQAGFDAGVLAVRAAFQRADIGAGTADDGGDIGKQAGAILGADEEFDGEGSGIFAAPLDGDAALGLIEQVLDVGTRAGVNGDASAAGDVADDVVPGNRIAAFGPKDE